MSEIAGPVPKAKCLSRTTSRQTTAVKWRRLWLVKDILMSLARQSGAELGRCEARNDADATDAKFKGVCILRRFCGTCHQQMKTCPQPIFPVLMPRRILRRFCGTCHPYGWHNPFNLFNPARSAMFFKSLSASLPVLIRINSL